MGLRLRPRDPSKHQVGNAILYGGDHRIYGTLPGTIGGIPLGEVSEAEVFFVETDFGNHMTLTWREVEEMFTVAGWQDHDEWRAARAELQNQPRLRTKNEEERLRDALFETAFNAPR